MTFAIGTRVRARPVVAGFTLIELILVMALFVIVIGIVSPELASFFRGRNLDNEAEQFLSLTRYGRSRAISEGVPVELWIDPRGGRYGLEALSGYTETRTNAVTYTVHSSVQISTSLPATTLTHSNYWTPTLTRTVNRGLPTIRFQPDGNISDTSPRDIYFKQGKDATIVIEEDPSNLRYELQASQQNGQ